MVQQKQVDSTVTESTHKGGGLTTLASRSSRIKHATTLRSSMRIIARSVIAHLSRSSLVVGV